MECSCSIDGCCDDGAYDDHEEKILIHNTPSVTIKCGECIREITLGEKFEWYRGQYDGETRTHHTCMDCVSLRDHFFCGWIFGSLWEYFGYHMDECNWEVPEKCLSNVTPTTRAKICEFIETEWERESTK